MRTLKRLALVTLGCVVAFLPACTPELRNWMIGTLTSALPLLTGCLSPGSLSPVQTNPQSSAVNTPATSQNASQQQTGSPVNVTIGDAFKAPPPPSSSPSPP